MSAASRVALLAVVISLPGCGGDDPATASALEAAPATGESAVSTRYDWVSVGCSLDLKPNCPEFGGRLEARVELVPDASLDPARTTLKVEWRTQPRIEVTRPRGSWVASRTYHIDFLPEALLGYDLENVLVSGTTADGTPVLERWQWTLPAHYWADRAEFGIVEPARTRLAPEEAEALRRSVGTPLHAMALPPIEQGASGELLVVGSAGRMGRILLETLEFADEDPFLRVDLGVLGTPPEDLHLMQWRGPGRRAVYAVQAPHPTHPRSLLILDEDDDGRPDSYQSLASLVLEGRPLNPRGGEHGPVVPL